LFNSLSRSNEDYSYINVSPGLAIN